MPNEAVMPNFEAVVVSRKGDGECTSSAQKLILDYHGAHHLDRCIHLYHGETEIAQLDLEQSKAFIKFIRG